MIKFKILDIIDGKIDYSVRLRLQIVADYVKKKNKFNSKIKN